MSNPTTSLRCLAIDDEPLALQQLTGYIEQVPFLTLAGACSSAVEARQRLKQEHIDAVFIDINMPDLNGLELIKSLVVPPLVVFTTAYSEYAVDAFKVDAVDYLLKPFTLDEFRQAAEKLVKRYNQNFVMATSAIDEDDAIYFKTDYKVVRIGVSDITHVEAMSEYLRIYSRGSKRPVIVLLSMKKMEERLPSKRFMRIHRSYIINLKCIKEVSKNQVLLDNDVTLPIGDLYKDSLMTYINSKFLSK